MNIQSVKFVNIQPSEILVIKEFLGNEAVQPVLMADSTTASVDHIVMISKFFQEKRNE